MKLTYAIIFIINSFYSFENNAHAQYSDAELFKHLLPTVKKNNSVDSLKRLIPTSGKDTNTVKLLWDISNIYLWSYPDSTLLYSLQGLQLAKKLSFEKGIIRLYHTMGDALAVKGNYSTALEIQLKALALAEKLNDPIQISLSYHWLGLFYLRSTDYQKALFYFQKLKLDDPVFQKNQELIFGLKGEAYFYLNILDSALIFTQNACSLDINAKDHWSMPYFWLASTNIKLQSLPKAIYYYRLGINAAVDKLHFIYGYKGLAAAFKKSGIIDSAMFYSRKAFEIAQTASFPFEIIETSKLLTDVYKQVHQMDSALKYEEITLSEKDSFFNKEKIKQLQNIAFTEQLHQQETEVSENENQNKIKIAVLAVIIIFSIVGVVLYVRKRNFLWVQNMRNKIALDINEQIGSTLSSISVFSDVLNTKLKADDIETAKIVNRIGQNARLTIASMNDIIWATKPYSESIAEIVIRMKEYCNNLFESKEVSYQFEVGANIESVKLPVEFRQNIYLIFKEALNNILKYAACKNILIKISIDNSILQLIIKDDGKGFNIDPMNTGNGLSNMKSRASSMHGSVLFESILNYGTKISLSVPFA